MTVKDLGERLTLQTLAPGDTARCIASCYISDLLSRVLGSCKEGDVWITVQASINMVAVAAMTGASCVILPEGLTAAENVIEKANEEGLTVFSSKETAFALATKLAELI